MSVTFSCAPKQYGFVQGHNRMVIDYGIFWEKLRSKHLQDLDNNFLKSHIFLLSYYTVSKKCNSIVKHFGPPCVIQKKTLIPSKGVYFIIVYLVAIYCLTVWSYDKLWMWRNWCPRFSGNIWCQFFWPQKYEIVQFFTHFDHYNWVSYLAPRSLVNRILNSGSSAGSRYWVSYSTTIE